MNMVQRDKLKQKGVKRFIKSFHYALDGLVYAFKYEQNMLVHILATVVVVLLGILVKLSFIEWLIIFLIISLVIATELINTSIEAVVDLVTSVENPLAKIAKDTAASAVMIFSIAAVLIGLFIFVPKIIILLGGLV